MRTVVATVPSSTNTVSNLPSGFLGSDSNDIANDFVAWNARKEVTEEAISDCFVTVADTAGDDFHEQLALLRLVDWDIFEDERLSGFLGDECFAAAGNGHCELVKCLLDRVDDRSHGLVLSVI